MWIGESEDKYSTQLFSNTLFHRFTKPNGFSSSLQTFHKSACSARGKTTTVSSSLLPTLVKWRENRQTGTFLLAAFPGKHDVFLDQTSSEYVSFPLPITGTTVVCFHLRVLVL